MILFSTFLQDPDTANSNNYGIHILALQVKLLRVLTTYFLLDPPTVFFKYPRIHILTTSKNNTVTMVSEASDGSEDGKPHAVITQDASSKSSSSDDDDDDIPFAILFAKKSDNAAIPEARKRAFKPIAMGPPKREDKFDLPVLPTGTTWKWEPQTGHKIVVMKDYALAASNAVQKLWEGSEVFVGTCSYHASARWLDTKGRMLLRDKENRSLMMADFEKYKNCPHKDLVEYLLVSMVQKWIQVYNEPHTADAWDKVWSLCAMTRVEINAGNPLQCGFPPDNNIVEAGNNYDKEFFDRKRKGSTQFIMSLSERIAHVSRADLSFIGPLKPRVHNQKFYQAVQKYRQDLRDQNPCFLNVRFTITNQNLDVPKGSFLIPTAHCLQEMKNVCTEAGTPTPDTPEQVKAWIKKAGWINQYRAILNMKQKSMDDTVWAQYPSQFDYVMDFFLSFHLMRPINAEENEVIAISNFFRMLSESGLRNIGLRGLKKKPPNHRLLSCDCPNYLHYGWCLHTCCYLMERDIVTSYPHCMDPTPLQEKKKPGRTRTAKAGEALSRK